MDIFEDIKRRLDKIEISDREKDLLLNHYLVTKKELKVDENVYEAFRIIHNNALGPGKGGIRFHPEVNEDEVKSLSFWMSLKTSLLGLPLGGAKGGVKVDVSRLKEGEIEKLSRAYAREFSEVIGVEKDIPAPDVYTNSEVMAFIMDEFEKVKNRHEPGVVTGKPILLGGLALRSDSTSAGGFIVLKEFFKKIGKDSEKIKVAVQGFGNAGMNIASYFEEKHCNIVAVSDSSGGILSENLCLNVKDVIDFKKGMGRLNDYNIGVKQISNKEILELDVDVLILAALENQITNENANNVKAKYILELANGPVSYEADEILFNKGVVVIPDILANAGGVVVSYFEWVQNKIGNILEENFLKDKFEKMMREAFEKVYELSLEEKVDMRTASYKLAIERILGAEKLRGRL